MEVGDSLEIYLRLLLIGRHLILFEIATHREAYVANMLVSQTAEEGWYWDVWLQRGFNNWETELVGAFSHALESQNPPNEDRDRMRWRFKSKGNFDTQSFYVGLRGSSSTTFPWNNIWGMKAPCQVSFFDWIAAWGKILIGDYLRRRGIPIVDWCCLCQCSEESVDHLLLHC